MTEREQKSGGAGCVVMGVIGFFLPVLYVLGVGPAAWLDSQFPQPNGNSLIRAIYAPLEFAAEWEPIGAAIHWYVSFWK